MSDKYILYDPADFGAVEIKEDTRDAEITRLREENARLTRENKVAFEAVGGVVQANDKLKEENARLRKALSYYAEENYNGHNGSGACARAAIREGGKDA